MKKLKLYKIERGIKIPEIVHKSNGQPSAATLTMHELQVGDSFLVRDWAAGEKASKQMRGLNGRNRKSGAKREFVSRRVKTGLRIWRTR